MFALVVDVGYSHNKFKYGDIGKKPTTCILPSGAGPATAFSRKSLEDDVDAPMVQIDGELWVTCVEPSLFNGIERNMDFDYSASKQYKALLYGAMAESGVTTIDILTLGLPVEQYKDEAYRASLKERYEGTHQVNPKLAVTVKHVHIQPQAGGAFMALCNRYAKRPEILEPLREGFVLIGDPGYFSFDWVLIDQGRFVGDSSGSSIYSMAKVMERWSELIAKEHFINVSPSRLEKRVRDGNFNMSIRGELVDIEPFYKEAAHYVGENLKIEIGKSVLQASREDGIQKQPEVVGCVGGGAKAFEQTMQEKFPKSLVLCAEDSQILNVEGFWLSTVMFADRLESESKKAEGAA